MSVAANPAVSAVSARPDPRWPQPAGKLDRRCRLQSKAEFDLVFRRGRRAHGLHLHVIAVILPTDRHPSRLGLAVARGVGHAPARARLRRLAREAFRGLRQRFSRPVELVISARQPWPEARLPDVLAELTALAAQMRLIAPIGPAA